MAAPAAIYIHEVIERHGAAIFHCNLSGHTSDRWLEVAAWM
jgi:hypothetical protein